MFSSIVVRYIICKPLWCHFQTVLFSSFSVFMICREQSCAPIHTYFSVIHLTKNFVVILTFKNFFCLSYLKFDFVPNYKFLNSIVLNFLVTCFTILDFFLVLTRVLTLADNFKNEINDFSLMRFFIPKHFCFLVTNY